MNSKKPLEYWAKRIAGIWLTAFFLIEISIVIRLKLQNFGGLPSAKVLDAVMQLWLIYLPYLGIIFGAFFSNHRKKRWGDDPVDSMFPKLVLIITVLFNLVLIIWTYDFLRDNFSNIEDYLSEINDIAAIIGFFICLFLSYLL